MICDDYPEAQIYLDLSETGKTASGALINAIRSIAPGRQIPANATEPQLRAFYHSALGNRRALIVIDNVCDRDQVQALLGHASSCVVVVAQKILSAPGMEITEILSLEPDDSSALLLRLAPRVGQARSTLARLCGHHPLALRAIGMLLKEHPFLEANDLAVRLNDEAARLNLEGTKAEGLSITIRACFLASYEHLRDDEKLCWLSLSVFPTTFDARAAAAVWGLGAESANDMLASLSRLSLVEIVGGVGSRRLRLHDLVQIFTKMLIVENFASRIEVLKLRHARHYLNTMVELEDLYESAQDPQGDTLRRFDSEWPNIEAGHAWVTEHQMDSLDCARAAAEYPNAAVEICTIRLHPNLHIMWLRVALNIAAGLDEAELVMCILGNLGNVYLRKPAYSLARMCFEQSLSYALKLNHPEAAALARVKIAGTDAGTGNYQAAIPVYEEVLHGEQPLDKLQKIVALGMLGEAYSHCGMVEQAIAEYKKALDLATANCLLVAEGRILSGLGRVYLHAELMDSDAALECFEKGLTLAQESKDGLCLASNLSGKGAALLLAGRLDDAIIALEESARVSHAIGQIEIAYYSVWNLGIIYERNGDLPKAIYHMQGLVDFLRSIGHADAEQRSSVVERLRTRQLSQVEQDA